MRGEVNTSKESNRSNCSGSYKNDIHRRNEQLERSNCSGSYKSRTFGMDGMDGMDQMDGTARIAQGVIRVERLTT